MVSPKESSTLMGRWAVRTLISLLLLRPFAQCNGREWTVKLSGPLLS